ncbi:helix-turn-helix transcriptional regulator [Streptomyces spinosus]|uniref:helix-turn-helix transcriptional regulator n=1 Tax=Streptomyces spinosus TaxID=2872623 RepID=UPI001CED2913|nr:helix-turn-helix transcriptional regulator [Streptomyces spinosus]
MDEATFGGLLRAARQRALLTLESLAEASGVSVRAISDMERGKSLPRQATLNELLDALELSEEERRPLVQASARRAGRVPRQLPPDLSAFRGRAGTRGNIGYVRQRLGDLDGAIADYRASLRLYEEVLDEYKQAEVLDDLASAQLERGETQEARANLVRSAELFAGLRVARAAEMRAKAEALAKAPTATPGL